MKIAMMTWFHHDKYGTVLQAAALSRVLQKMGHEAQVIHYYPHRSVYTLPGGSARKAAVQAYRDQRKVQGNPRIVGKLAGEKFNAFREKHLHLTRYCATLPDLESLNDEYDAFICGSDLIWLPRYFDPHYYLDFVRNPDKMIAYAPSILDEGCMDKDVIAEMDKLIRRFHHLSVREESGRKILDSVFDIHTEEVADPVLLLDAQEWAEMTAPHALTPQSADEQETSDEKPEDTQEETAEDTAKEPQRGYVLACFQGHNKAYWGAVDGLAARLDLDVKIIPIYEKDQKRKDCIREAVGPEEYVDLIRKADYICTDSYHASALAILFHKELCCFARYTERTQLGRNSRIRHILDTVGLLGRLYDPEAPLENYLEKIDWIPVNFKLDALRLKSMNYLEQALGAVEEKKQANTLPGEKVHRHILEGYSLCCGCGACSAVCSEEAIRITLSEKGFYEASVDEEKCVRCGACEKVCPFGAGMQGKKIAAGKLLSYTDEDPEVVRSSGAGGLASRLAMIFHDRGAAVCGCIYDEQEKGARQALIMPGEEEERLIALRGTKYLQSDMRPVWESLKNWSGRALIFGTPCQVSAVKNVLGDRKNVLYVDFVCVGVPSANLYRKYMKSIEKKHRLLHREPKVDSFARMLKFDACSMEACYECRFRDSSAADLRLGDLRTDFPGRRGDAGASLAISLTPKGERMLGELMLAGYWEGLKKEDIAAYIETHRAKNPIKPVFYDRLMESLGSEQVSMKRLIGDYVRPLEKRYGRKNRELMFYEVGVDDKEGIEEKKTLLLETRE